MRRLFLFSALLVGTALALAGCDAAGLDDFEEEVAVSVLLVAEQPLPLVYLTRTGRIDVAYDPLERAITGAEVTIALLAADGSVEARYPYHDLATVSDSLAGIYSPVTFVPVLGSRRYRFEAVVTGFPDPVTAETTVPEAFEIVRPPPDTVVFQQGESPSLDVSPSATGGGQAVYVFTITSLTPSVEALTPFAADIFANRDVQFETLVATTSPLINEENAERNPDGTLRIRIPWFGFNFYGPNAVTLTVLDEALARFLEFQAVQFVPTTISPGEIPNVPTNVVGGVGIFAAAAQAEVVFTVARP